MDREAELYEIARALEEMGLSDLTEIALEYAYNLDLFGLNTNLQDVAQLAWATL